MASKNPYTGVYLYEKPVRQDIMKRHRFTADSPSASGDYLGLRKDSPDFGVPMIKNKKNTPEATSTYTPSLYTSGTRLPPTGRTGSTLAGLQLYKTNSFLQTNKKPITSRHYQTNATKDVGFETQETFSISGKNDGLKSIKKSAATPDEIQLSTVEHEKFSFLNSSHQSEDFLQKHCNKSNNDKSSEKLHFNTKDTDEFDFDIDDYLSPYKKAAISNPENEVLPTKNNSTFEPSFSNDLKSPQANLNYKAIGSNTSDISNTNNDYLSANKSSGFGNSVLRSKSQNNATNNNFDLNLEKHSGRHSYPTHRKMEVQAKMGDLELL